MAYVKTVFAWTATKDIGVKIVAKVSISIVANIAVLTYYHIYVM